MFFSLARKCIACIGILSSGVSLAFATEHDPVRTEPAGELTLKQAVEIALARNPDLIAAHYELKAADARITQSGLRRNPEVSADIENFAGGGATRGTDALETTLSLSQVIELGGKRVYRTNVATLDREVIGVEQQAKQLDVLTEVTRRFIDLVVAQGRLALAYSTRELEQRTLDAIVVRVQAARSPEAERSRARIALIRAQIEEQQAQSAIRGARANLAALWGNPEPVFKEANADLFVLEAVRPFESLVAQLAGNPDFVRFASEARLRDAELRLAQAQARPNLTFGIGVRRLESGNDHALVAAFSMPLPVFDRNQGAIREAQARRAQTDALREATFVRARGAVFALYQQLLALRVRVETLRSEALPQAQQALAQSQYGYERGRFSYLELATAQQELLGLRTAALDAAADYHRILAEIERLTGQPVATTISIQESP